MTELSLLSFKSFERLPMQVVDISSLTYASMASSIYNAGIKTVGKFLYLQDAWNMPAVLLNGRDMTVAGSSTYGVSPYALEVQDGLMFTVGIASNRFLITPCADQRSRTILGETKWRPPSYLLRDSTAASWLDSYSVPTHANVGIPGLWGSWWLWGANNDRYRVSPKLANDTFPTVVDPTTAPTLAISAGTGHLPASTVFVRLAWMTKTNTKRSRYGATIPTAAASIAVSLNDTITVTIPTFPTGVIGCMVFAGTNENDLALSGVARVAGAHPLRAHYDQLNMGKMLFLRHNNNPALSYMNLTNIATTTSFYTTGSPNPTNGSFGQLFSPFFPDFWNLYFPTAGSSGGQRNYDVINLATMGTTLNTPVGPYSAIRGPLVHRHEMYLSFSTPMLDFNELGATLSWDVNSSEGGAAYYINCNVTGELLYGGTFPGLYAGSAMDRVPLASQFIDGIGMVVNVNSKRRQLYRQPIRILP